MTSGKASNPAGPQGQDAEIDDDLYLAARVHAERDRAQETSGKESQKRPSRGGRPWLAVARSVV